MKEQTTTEIAAFKPEAVATPSAFVAADDKERTAPPSQVQSPREISVPTSPVSAVVGGHAAAGTELVGQTPSATPVETARNSPETQQRNAERDREVVEEFEYLLEKSQQLFSGLSDLPEIGSKYWMPHFQRTFEVYTRLWKFQSQHRLLLEKPSQYGLKRWEVGEIASKIGQLYYRYYLRTSDTNNLYEAYVFYNAIRDRNYFKGEQEVKNSALMIKKLRYYARFIVVCLQMNNTAMMVQLLEEVKGLIDVYAATFNPVDKMEWSLVVKEMALFMQAVCSPVPLEEKTGVSLPISYRLSMRKRPKIDKDGSRFRLQEAVIVGNRPTQIKFSELTLDMYYMLQMLERESESAANFFVKEASTKETEGHSTADSTAVAPAAPQEKRADTPVAAGTTDNAAVITAATSAPVPAAAAITESTATSIAGATSDNIANATAAPEPDIAKGQQTNAEKKHEVAADPEKEKTEAAVVEKETERERAVRRVNPHKYVLYQPHFSQIQVYLASAFREIGEQGCVLLYLSSDGSGVSSEPTAAAAEIAVSPATTHGFTGGISTSRRNLGDNKDRKVEQLIHTLHPADLIPYTRKPFFLIVESTSSAAYKNIPNLFNQPLLCLLSPSSYPITSNSGSIYTFFLHSPVTAFCIISHISTVSKTKWKELQSLFDQFEDRVFELLNQHVVDPNVRRFLFDDFLSQVMERHVVCCVVLHLHNGFTRPEHFPQAAPDRFRKVVESDELVRKARYIVSFCAVDELYDMGDLPKQQQQQQKQQQSSPSSLASSPLQPLTINTVLGATEPVVPAEATNASTINATPTAIAQAPSASSDNGIED
ncbi:hypothetical protein FB645_001024 [Coemansia sp. IMI 203386]|nr:hypothetical protein FB645_001024 [Coemansia sp. IMI 203386]